MWGYFLWGHTVRFSVYNKQFFRQKNVFASITFKFKKTFQTIILGVIEGITEFLPISSTAHLIMGRYFLGINTTEFLNFFIIFIQLGAISAVPILYFKRLISGINIYLYLITSFIPAIIF